MKDSWITNMTQCKPNLVKKIKLTNITDRWKNPEQPRAYKPKFNQPDNEYNRAVFYLAPREANLSDRNCWLELRNFSSWSNDTVLRFFVLTANKQWRETSDETTSSGGRANRLNIIISDGGEPQDENFSGTPGRGNYYSGTSYRFSPSRKSKTNSCKNRRPQ